MSSSAASTEPRVESTKSQRLDAPLWKYVTITSGSDKSGGNVAFTCNFCGGKLTGSHSRVKSHLLRIKGTGVRICPTITRDQTVELQTLLDHCDQQLNAKAQHKVALPPSSMTGSAHSLNPKYYSSQWLEEDPNRVPPHKDAEINNERRRCFQKLFPDSQTRNKVMEEFARFSLNMGDFSSSDALENKFCFEPLTWWVSYGPSTPLLQSLKRNKLQPRRAQDLVYVHTNLRLLARKSSSYYKDMDSMWDLGGDDHDSMEQGNIDVLEMATLSLDVPVLERMVIDDEMET
ncbi:hypothetical protein ACLB2K_022844 [Fragaria x ananassa]